MPRAITASRVRRIEQLAAQLQSPHNFFFGVREDSTRLASNVVLFSRLSGQHLMPSGTPVFHHHRFVLSINLRTAATVTIDGRSYPFVPGECSVIFPYQLHAYSNLSSDTLCWIFATFELAESSWVGELKNRILRTPDVCLPWIEQMVRQWRERREKAAQLPYLTGMLLLEMIEAARLAPPVRMGQTPSELQKSVTESARGLQSHLLPRIHNLFEQGQRNARVKDYARAMGVSESHLRSEFRRQTGLKVGHYIRDMRLNRAAAMLVDTALSVGEVSARCGFESPFTFSRTFRRVIGMPPLAYRRQFWPKPTLASEKARGR